MKLKAQLSGKEHDLSIKLAGEQVVAEVNGRSYKLELHNPADSEYLLLTDGLVYDCRVEAQRAPGEAVVVHLRGKNYYVTMTDPKRLRGSASSDAHDHGAAEIVAPMPGKIVRVLVDVGAEVLAGTGLVVVEAMKMQNEMKSPKPGIVVAINVSVGGTVNAGDVLAIVE